MVLIVLDLLQRILEIERAVHTLISLYIMALICHQGCQAPIVDWIFCKQESICVPIQQW